MIKLGWQTVGRVLVCVLMLAAGGVAGSFYRSQEIRNVQAQLETAKTEAENYRIQNTTIVREAENADGRLRRLKALNTQLIVAGRAAVQVSRASIDTARRQACISRATIRHQRSIVRRTVNPVVKGMRAVYLRRIAGAGAGWFPVAGDVVDSAVTGAALIQDRNQENALRNLDSRLEQASAWARRDCQRRRVFGLLAVGVEA